ncbi:hypothetical protein [Fangia hongkongensis]|nr:hypothetical protein [Fangia hongkongensis]MBK2125227.1 hypothetical protein [Fangia hongkongensis]
MPEVMGKVAENLRSLFGNNEVVTAGDETESIEESFSGENDDESSEVSSDKENYQGAKTLTDKNLTEIAGINPQKSINNDLRRGASLELQQGMNTVQYSKENLISSGVVNQYANVKYGHQGIFADGFGSIQNQLLGDDIHLVDDYTKPQSIKVTNNTITGENQMQTFQFNSDDKPYNYRDGTLHVSLDPSSKLYSYKFIYH